MISKITRDTFHIKLSHTLFSYVRMLTRPHNSSLPHIILSNTSQKRPFHNYLFLNSYILYQKFYLKSTKISLSCKVLLNSIILSQILQVDCPPLTQTFSQFNLFSPNLGIINLLSSSPS